MMLIIITVAFSLVRHGHDQSASRKEAEKLMHQLWPYGLHSHCVVEVRQVGIPAAQSRTNL
jgi:hypothetical protein